MDVTGAAGNSPYWKFLNLITSSVGPFLSTFIVNIAIIIRIFRVRRRRNNLSTNRRVHFTTMPNLLSERLRLANESEGAAVLEISPRDTFRRSEETSRAFVVKQSSLSEKQLVNDEPANAKRSYIQISRLTYVHISHILVH